MSNCHDHQHCINDALDSANAICKERGVKLTALREQVLLLIWQSHKALGAYTLIDMLAASQQRRVAPPTVYRALEFLLECKLIHRINSINAYIGCINPESHRNKLTTSHHFIICNNCHDTQEVINADLTKAINQTCEPFNFLAKQQWLEISGLCEQCQNDA